MMLLIALAITVAFVASWGAQLGLLSHELEFWWELALLIVIMLLGHWIEMRSLAASASALDSLAALLPDTAERVDGDEIVEVAPADLRVGDVVVVRPGGRVPADGEVVAGSASVDESMITGESRPVVRGRRRSRRGRHGVDRLVAAGPGRRHRRGHRPGRHPAAGQRGAELGFPGAAAGRPGRRLAVLVRAGRRR